MKYSEFVSKLASGSFTPNAITREEIVLALEDFVWDGAYLDEMKRALFYGERWRHDMYSDVDEEAAFAPDFTINEWHIFHGIIGIITEASELAEVALRMITDGEVDRENLIEELGDLRFYSQLDMNALGISDRTVRIANMNKLYERYPEGFSEERALSRDTEAEMKAMSYTKDLQDVLGEEYATDEQLREALDNDNEGEG